jgi:hypothetical protein
VIDPVGVLDGVRLAVGAMDGVRDVEGVMDGVGDPDGVMDGDGVLDGVGDGLGRQSVVPMAKRRTLLSLTTHADASGMMRTYVGTRVISSACAGPMTRLPPPATTYSRPSASSVSMRELPVSPTHTRPVVGQYATACGAFNAVDTARPPLAPDPLTPVPATRDTVPFVHRMEIS